MRTGLAFVLGGLLFAGETMAQEGDPEAGRLVAGQCRTCHGLDGFARIPIAPHIGGEPAAYLAGQLQAFRDGNRENEMMTVVARSLSDQQIADVSSWYAAHQVVASVPEGAGNPPLACAGCHGAEGIALVQGVPNLAGETNIYIETQLNAFRSGQRNHQIMSQIASGLSDAQIRAAADWYGSVNIEIVAAD